MNSPTYFTLRYAAHALLLGVTTSLHAGFVDFNNAGDFTSNFTVLNGNVVEDATGGIGGTRAAKASATTDFTIINGTALSSSVGQPVVASIAFKTTVPGVNDSQTHFTTAIAGFSTLANSVSTLDGAVTGQGYYKTSSSPDIAVQGTGIPSIGLSGYGSGFTLTANSWYKLESKFTKESTAYTWTYEVNLYSLGASGTGSPSLVGGSSYQYTFGSGQNAQDFYNATTLYPYYSFASGVDNGGLTTIDNASFTAVPEPAVTAPIVGLAMLGFGAWRRRRWNHS